MPKGEIRRDWVVAHLKNRQLNLAERTLLGLCQQVGAQIAQA